MAGLVGLSVGAAVSQADAISDFYRQLYPSDAVRRQALTRCFLSDQRFDRFNRSAREACYLQHEAAQARQRIPQQNFVDQWRAAGQGRLPRNDIRVEAQNRQYVNLLAAGRSP